MRKEGKLILCTALLGASLTLGTAKMPIYAAEQVEQEEAVQLIADQSAEQAEKNGWVKENGKTYYYVSNVKKTGWQTIKGKKYYFTPKKGEMLTGKQKIGKETFYFASNGQMQTGWKTIKGKKYYFDSKTGKMFVGKKKISKSTYYFNTNGQMKTGWVTIKGKKYYFAAKTGKMTIGKAKVGKYAYYFNKNGIMQKSKWQSDGKKTYYCNKNGRLQSGWMKLKGKQYYFSTSNHVLQTGLKTIEGKKYYFEPTKKGELQIGHIVDTPKGSFFAEPGDGICVESQEIKLAVAFVKKYTDNSWSNDVKLAKCFEALWKNYSYQRFYENPTAQSMSGYATYMLQNGRGNCFRYAASFACIAKVLGYDSRVAVGSISSTRGGMTPHGWAEINVGGTWYMCDANMQKNKPEINSYMRTEATYAYRHTCDARYTLHTQKGGVFWQ
ncbi:MAG: transglutaminase domain-containing protein [Lachnospiraceae bacterium]